MKLRLIIFFVLAVPLPSAAQTPQYIPTTGGVIQGPLKVESLNSVYKAEEYAGATADVKINACLAAAGAGGICDARGFGDTTQTLSGTVTIGANQTLLMSPATTFVPGSATLTLVSIQPGGKLRGASFNVAGASFTGNVISFTGNYGTRAVSGTNGVSTLIRNVHINGDYTGNGIYMGATSSSTQSVYGVSIEGLRVEGMQNCIDLYATGSGFINGNLFDDVICNGSVNGLNAQAAGGTIDGNFFISFMMEPLTGETASGVSLVQSSSGVIRRNVFDPANLWDFQIVGAPPIAVTGTAANIYNNTFVGRWDGTLSDSTGNDNYINVATATWALNQSLTLNTLTANTEVISPKIFATTQLNAGTATTAAPIMLGPPSGSTSPFWVCNEGTYVAISYGASCGAGASIAFNNSGGINLPAGGNYSINGTPLNSTELADSTYLVRFVGSLTTTAAASDTLSAPSVPAGAACSVEPQNSAAAGLTGVYVPVVATAGSVVVDHSTTAGGIFSVFCQY